MMNVKDFLKSENLLIKIEEQFSGSDQYLHDINLAHYIYSLYHNIEYIPSKFEKRDSHAQLNCYKIYYLFEENELIYENHFEDFLTNGQIDVVDFYGHTDELIKLLFEARRHFTKSYLDLDKILSYVSEHIVTFRNLNYDFTYLEFSILDKYFSISKNNKDKTYNLNSHNQHNVSKLHSYDAVEITFLYRKLHYKGSKKHTRQVWLKIAEFKNLFKTSIYNDDYLSNDYLKNLPLNYETYLNEINNLITTHRQLISVFLEISLYEQIKRYNVISEYIEREGSYIIGLLEQKEIDTTLTFSKWVNKLVKKHKALTNKVLIEPLPIESKYLGCQIKELYTPEMLTTEGELNDHCVGGYSNKISETRRIFSIAYKELHFTTEVIYCSNNLKHKDIGWKVLQCKAFQNMTPSFYNADVEDRVNAVCSYLITRLNSIYNPSLNYKY